LRSQKQGNQKKPGKPKGSSLRLLRPCFSGNVAPYAQLSEVGGYLKTRVFAFRALLGIKTANIAFAATIFSVFPIVINPTSRAYRNSEIPVFRISENHRDMSPILTGFWPKTRKRPKSCAYGWSKPEFPGFPEKRPYPHNAGLFRVFSAEMWKNPENHIPGAFPIGSFPGFRGNGAKTRKSAKSGKMPKSSRHVDS